MDTHSLEACDSLMMQYTQTLRPRPEQRAGACEGDTGAGNDERREILRQRLGNRECALRFPSGSCEEPTRLAAFA